MSHRADLTFRCDYTACRRELDSGKFCAGCGVAAYCNATCQQADWPAHKSQCRVYSNIGMPEPHSTNLDLLMLAGRLGADTPLESIPSAFKVDSRPFAEKAVVAREIRRTLATLFAKVPAPFCVVERDLRVDGRIHTVEKPPLDPAEDHTYENSISMVRLANSCVRIAICTLHAGTIKWAFKCTVDRRGLIRHELGSGCNLFALGACSFFHYDAHCVLLCQLRSLCEKDDPWFDDSE